jgi:hypothetical protein
MFDARSHEIKLAQIGPIQAWGFCPVARGLGWADFLRRKAAAAKAGCLTSGAVCHEQQSYENENDNKNKNDNNINSHRCRLSLERSLPYAGATE